MPSMMYPPRKEKLDDLGFPRTPDRLPELCGFYVQQSEVCETMTGTCGPYNLGGSTTALTSVGSHGAFGLSRMARLSVVSPDRSQKSWLLEVPTVIGSFDDNRVSLVDCAVNNVLR